jgi:hypothetical protein
MFARPKIERGRVNLIHQRRGETQPGEIHSFYIVLAGITGLDPNIIKRRGFKVTELGGSFFLAVYAGDSAEFP